MALTSSIDLAQWRSKLPPALQNLMTRGHDGAGARNTLLRKASNVLLVFDDRMYHPDSGSWRSLKGAAESGSGMLSADVLAAAAEQLLPVQKNSQGILLLLPSSEYIATTVNMPGVAPQAIKPALQLQASTLLPGYEEDLVLAVNPVDTPEESFSNTAVWMPRRRLDALFKAFASRGLFLAAAMPRILAVAEQYPQAQLEDRDGQSITRLYWRDGAIRQWQQINRIDLEQEEFLQQWQQEATAYSDVEQVELSRAEDYLGHTALSASRAYSFFPSGARAAKNQLQKGKRLAMAAGVAALALVIGLLPFLLQSIETRRLIAQYERSFEMASGARADQAAVREFEARWGVLSEFPRQDIATVLLTLQEVISPSTLSALELEEGRITIEGESSDPQNLLQQLEQDPLFTEVDFARATSNNRYFIDLRLTTADFPAYYQWYFPERR